MIFLYYFIWFFFIVSVLITIGSCIASMNHSDAGSAMPVQPLLTALFGIISIVLGMILAGIHHWF